MPPTFFEVSFVSNGQKIYKFEIIKSTIEALHIYHKQIIPADYFRPNSQQVSS